MQLEERSEEQRQGISLLGSAVVVLLLITHVSLAWVVRSQAITTGNDDALYLLLARSLRSFHYLDSHILGSPPHAQYPPGYPAFLALFGTNFNAAIAGGIVLSAIGLLLAYDLARRAIGSVPALIVLAVLCINPALVSWAGSLRSESLFMTSSIAAIWCASRTPLKPGWLAAAGGLAIYAALVRSVGVALPLALLLVWVLQRRYKAAVVFSGIAGVLIGGWLLFTALAPGKFSGRSYAAALQRAETTTTMFSTLMYRLETSLAYFYKHIPSALSVPTLESTSVDNVIWALFLAVTLGAGLYFVWRKFPIIVVFLIGYAIILIVYPFKLTRFVLPIVPLIVLVSVGGLVFFARRFTGRGTLAATALFCLPLLVGSLRRDHVLLKTESFCTSAQPLGPNTCSTAEQRSFFAAASYAKDHTPPSSSFLTLKEATFALLSDRKVQHPGRVIVQDSLRVTDAMRQSGLEYVLLTPLFRSNLSRFLLPHCGELVVVRAFPADTYILRLAQPDAVRGGNGCEVLTHYATNYSPREAGSP